MSIFGTIKDAIFGHKPAAAPAPATSPGPASQPAPEAPVQNIPAANAPAAMSEVDVEANLAEMAQGLALNWRTSIVDLMKLLGIDSSLENRRALARELGYTGELNGSAEMNVWLHKATMRKLAESGGKVPADMLG